MRDEESKNLTLYPSSRRGLPVRESFLDAIDPDLLDESDANWLLEYWRILRRRKGTIVLASMLGALAGLLFSLPQTPIYQSRAVLEIQGINERFLNFGEMNPTTSATEGTSSDIGTHVRILQSAQLVERVVGKLRLEERAEFAQGRSRLAAWRSALGLPVPEPAAPREQAVGRAAASLQVRPYGNTRIVEVISDSTAPAIAAAFANTLVEEYIQQALEARWEATRRTEQWLSRQLEELRAKLETSEQQLQDYARDTGLSFTSEDGSAAQERLRQLQTEWSDAQAQRIAKQSIYELADSSPPEALAALVDIAGFRENSQKLQELRRSLEALKPKFTPRHPQVQDLVRQIEDFQSAIEQEKTIVLERIANEYNASVNREQMLKELYVTQASLVSGEAEKSIQYNILKGEIETTRKIHGDLLQKVKEAGVVSALSANNVRIVDPAQPPAQPYKPRHLMNALWGLLAGAVFGIAFVFVRETTDRSLREPGEAAEILRVPELGVIPTSDHAFSSGSRTGIRFRVRFAQKGAPARLTVSRTSRQSSAGETERIEIAGMSNKNSYIAESFRATLTSILLSGRQRDRPKRLLITSPGPGDGKTTIASNLALCLAEINQRVLLIDGDIRKPRLHEIYKVSNDWGLTTLLQRSESINGEFSAQSYTRATAHPNLFLIPAGPRTARISTILYSPRAAELLQAAEKEFDAVLIDTPPMMQMSDARVLAEIADAVILVLRAGQTSRHTAKAAIERFMEDGTPILGTVLNGWDPNLSSNGYHDYYGYYRKYYGDDPPAPLTASDA